MKKTTLGLASLFILFVFFESLLPIRSDDFFMYLTLGRRFFSPNGFGEIDPYLFTIPDFHWHVWHEWLSYVYYYGVYKTFGFLGVILLRAGIVTGFFGGLFYWGRKRLVSPPVLVGVLSLAFWVAMERSRVDRASIFSDLFTALTAVILLSEKDSLSRFAKWFFPLLFVLWVNLHPGYLIGWFLIGLYVVFHRGRGWPTLLLSMLATLLNPLGWKGAVYPLRFIFSPDFKIFKQINSEWMPTFGHYLLPREYQYVLAIFLVISIATLIFGAIRGRWFSFVIGFLFVVLGVSAVRFLALAGFGLGGVLVFEISHWQFLSAIKLLHRRAWAFGLVFLLFVLSPWAQTFTWAKRLSEGQVIFPSVPMAAAQFLENEPPGNVFNEYVTGGLLAFILDGKMKIAGHGHIDQPNLIVSHYFRFSNSRQDWEDIVVKGNVEYFFVFRDSMVQNPGAGWVQELETHWLKIYSDGLAVIFRRIR